MAKLIQLSLLTFVFITNIGCEDQIIQIKKLRNQLLDKQKYDKWSRPVKDHKTSTLLKMSFSVTRLNDLCLQTWVDEHLVWNPNDFGGLKEIHFSSDEIWKPDITVWNSADHMNLDESLAKAHFVVSFNGTVEWFTVGSIKTSCNVDLTDYPNDEQECDVYFGTWSHNQDQINITTLGNEFFSGGVWYPNPEWDVLKITPYRHDDDYPGYGVYTTLNALFRIKRNGSLFYYVISLPSIASVLLTLSIFWLPQQSSTRFTLGTISLFISFTALLFLGIQLGTASFGSPYVVRNLSLLVIMNGIALILSTLSQHIYAACLNTNLRVPEFLVKLLSGVLINVFCLSGNCFNDRNLMSGDRMELTQEDDDNNSDNSDKNIARNEWKLVFIFIDRLFFIIYSIIFMAKRI